MCVTSACIDPTPVPEDYVERVIQELAKIASNTSGRFVDGQRAEVAVND